MSEAVRIWALHCPFDKYGAPVMGNSGRSVEGVVVIRIGDWTNLCQAHPTLGAAQFDVGTAEVSDAD